jgi:hypothetical protein
MNRLVAVLVLMPFCTAAFAKCEDLSPKLGSNVACLDPTGPIKNTTPTQRSRTFGMNGRTMDPTTPATANLFIVFQGQWSVAQVETELSPTLGDGRGQAAAA